MAYLFFSQGQFIYFSLKQAQDLIIIIILDKKLDKIVVYT